MPEFLGWGINPATKELKLFTNEEETIFVLNKEIKGSITREKDTNMIRLTVGNVSFVISDEHKKINIFCK